MKNRMRVLFGAAALVFAGQVSAQESVLEYVVHACENDLTQYCSTVTPGNGRLLHCVAAHEDKLSGQCEYALYQAASLLQQLSAAINYFAQSCQTEIATLCSDVKAGEGRLLACLTENEADVGDTCKKAIADTVGE